MVSETYVGEQLGGESRDVLPAFDATAANGSS